MMKKTYISPCIDIVSLAAGTLLIVSLNMDDSPRDGVTGDTRSLDSTPWENADNFSNWEEPDL